MSTITLNERNTKIDAIIESIVTAKSNKETMLSKTMLAIKSEIDTNIESGLGYKKALKKSKEDILSDLYVTAQTKKGVDYEKYNGNKEINRVFNIAFTAIYRNLDINFDALTVAQTENLVNYGTVQGVNDLIDDDGDYTENAIAYIKSLKTRDVTSKTFEKKAKLA